MTKTRDDWDWTKYTNSDYYPQQLEILKTHDLFVTPNGFSFTKDGITFSDNLHPNSKELYHILHETQPKSILECGCGACISLKNIETIFPNMDVYGIDISQNQLDMGKWFTKMSDKLSERVSIMDIAEKTPDRKYDFVFSNAVLMHLSETRAMNALNNMKRISNKYVFLVENPTVHKNWHGKINNIFSGWKMSTSGKYINYGILLSKI